MAARRLLALCAALTVGTALVSPTAHAASDDEPTRVMFVGDSITGSPGCWRAPVWVSLTDAAHHVDMVGPRTENECGDVTNAAGEAWDPDNYGIGGITTTRMWVEARDRRRSRNHGPGRRRDAARHE